MANHFKSVRILGIDFFDDSLDRALRLAHEEGGLFLAPSGPGLADLGKDIHYDAALRAADVNLIDSGYLALLWQQRTRQAINRHSGLKFIKALLDDPRFQTNRRQLWIMPSRRHCEATQRYLQSNNIELDGSHFYEAPYYRESPIYDTVLLQRIKNERPDYVILAIAGGKQEVLGHWLRDQLDHRPAIVCIGAAIAFLSGQQANIPTWADRIYVGWFLRILSDPKTYLPRYWKARKLRYLIKAHGVDAPNNY